MSFCRRPKYKKVELQWVYDKVQSRLADNQLEENVLMDYLEEVETTICNYINRTYVPEPLRFVFVNLTMDLLKSQALNGNIENETLEDIGLGALASIKDGDSELKFKTSASANTGTGAHVADVDSLLYNYTQQLDKYRLIRW